MSEELGNTVVKDICNKLIKIIMSTSCISKYLNRGQQTLSDYRFICVISGFRREVDKNCVLLGCYAGSSGNSFLTFRDNLLVPSSSVKNNS
jgi:hypothetical protein